MKNIRGYKWIDHQYQREYIKSLTPKLSKVIDVRDLIPHLHAAGVLSDNDKEEILQEDINRGKIAAAVLLLDRVQRKHSRWYNKLIECLRDSGRDDIAEDLDIPRLTSASGGKC